MRLAILSVFCLAVCVSPAWPRDSFEGKACDDHDPCTVEDHFLGGMCRGTPKDCSDGLECTEDFCDRNSGRCVAALRIDACLIDGVCRRNGETSSTGGCLVCQPSRSTSTWTETMACDDGNPCTFGDHCQQGVCTGTPYFCTGAGLCSLARCDGKGGCIEESLAGHCRIGGLCIREGETDPADPCLRCDPRSAADRWTVATGAACPGGTCVDGRCLATLVVAHRGRGKGRVVGPGFVCTDDCVRNVVPERPIQLTVVAELGSEFRQWGGACEGVAPCDLAPVGETHVTAVFERASTTQEAEDNRPFLTIVRSGRGRVRGAGGRIACGSVCGARVAAGETIQLEAEPAPGYRFAGWKRGCGGVAPVCTLSVSADIEVEAEFVSD